MEKKGYVSIVVPVYNVETKIQRCIDSVIEQTYPLWELILVDDGSKDGSLKLCQKAAEADERIIVISKNNGGVSSARNAGLDVANGEYVTFCDSDDWIDKDMLECMVEIQKEKSVEMVMCGLTMHYDEHNVRTWYPLSSKELMRKDYTTMLRNITASGSLNSPCNKLFLLDKISTRFNINKSMGEDMDFNIAYFDNIGSMAVYWACPYHYDMTTVGSLTKQLTIQVSIALENIEHKENFLKRHNAYYPEFDNSYTQASYQRLESFLKLKKGYSDFVEFYNQLIHEYSYGQAIRSHGAYGRQAKMLKKWIETDNIICLWIYTKIRIMVQKLKK